MIYLHPRYDGCKQWGYIRKPHLKETVTECSCPQLPSRLIIRHVSLCFVLLWLYRQGLMVSWVIKSLNLLLILGGLRDSIWVWSQPMRDDITMQRRLSLAEPMPTMIPAIVPVPVKWVKWTWIMRLQMFINNNKTQQDGVEHRKTLGHFRSINTNMTNHHQNLQEYQWITTKLAHPGLHNARSSLTWKRKKHA